MNNNLNRTRFSLKFIITLSGLLIFINLLKFFSAFKELHNFALTNDIIIFDNCIKYHLLAKLVFTIFSLLIGVSAFIMRFIRLFADPSLVDKLMNSFMYCNYLLFGS